MSFDISIDRLTELETRIHELESRFHGIVTVIAGQRPVSSLLETQRVSESEQREVYEMIREMSVRLGRGEPVPFTEFEERITGLLPQLRGDRRLIEVLVE